MPHRPLSRRQQLDSSEHLRAVRPIERYVYNVVFSQSNVPRTVDVPYILRHQIDRGMAVAYVIVLFCAWAIVHQLELSITLGAINIRDWLGILAVCIAIPCAGYDVFNQPYRWWLATHTGRYTMAEVQAIKRKQYRKSEAMEGAWHYSSEGRTYTHRFRLWPHESGGWIWKLAVGSRVHVVLHPNKPNVLIALGMVEENDSVQS